MIDPAEIREIIATYQKHGWILRRLLLSPSLTEKLGGHDVRYFQGVAILDSAFDAAWFSRPPTDGGVAWEIRYLGGFPFALLENINEKDSEFEASLRRVEARLCETITAKESA